MKKFINLVLIVIVAFILVGCKKDKDDKIKITIGMWPDEVKQADVAMFNEWKRLFEKDYPQYKIVGQPYDYNVDTFAFLAGTGQIPTVFQTWFTEPQKLIQGKYVKDITDLLIEFGWYDKMDPDMRVALTANDRVYGVPRDGYGLGLFLNLKVFEEAGLLEDLDGDGTIDIYDEEGNPLYPTTFEEVEIMSTEITENLEDVAGFMALSASKQGGWQFSNIAWNFGAELEVKENGKWMSKLDSVACVEALEWIQRMKHEKEALPNEISLAYNDCWTKIGQESVAMCIVGSDAIATAYTNMELETTYPFAFVPMPKGPHGDQYSLFGGTPFMFSSRASDEQVKGALRFLEYMGRSPELTDVSKKAIEDGMQVAVNKGMPILPDIKPWINSDYVNYKKGLEELYCNVNMDYFKDFYATFDDMKRTEEPQCSQELYTTLDNVLQNILGPSGISLSAKSLLSTANQTFQKDYLNLIK